MAAMFLRRNSLFSIVCSEPKVIIWHFKKDIVFAHYSSCTCSPYRSLASVGLAQARPNNYTYIYKSNLRIVVPVTIKYVSLHEIKPSANLIYIINCLKMSVIAY